jgi:hypothetical protein
MLRCVSTSPDANVKTFFVLLARSITDPNSMTRNLAASSGASLLTYDQDFEKIAPHCGLQLYRAD